MHQHDQRPRVLVRENERLDHRVLIDIQFAGRNPRAAMLFVGVDMAGEGDPVRFQKPDCRCFGGVAILVHLTCQPRG